MSHWMPLEILSNSRYGLLFNVEDYGSLAKQSLNFVIYPIKNEISKKLYKSLNKYNSKTILKNI